jgi:hypothetical protein
MRRKCRATMFSLVACASVFLAFAAAEEAKVTPVSPPELGFFSKQVIFECIPIKAHQVVADAALLEARRRLARMLAHMPIVVENLVDFGAEMHIIGKDQQNSDLPYLRHWKGKPYESYGKQFKSFDQRNRGIGGILASCGEENLLKLLSDRFKDHRDICTHEFAHTVFNYGLSPNVRELIQEQFKNSTGICLWKTAYASTNADEFFAELSMWYFDSRGDYGRIKPTPQEGRDWLLKYDPEAFTMLDKIYSGAIKIERITWEDLAARPAADEAALRSHSSRQPTTLLFENRTATDYSLFWLDFQGKRKPYGVLHAGENRGLNTFATHPWLVAKPDGQAVAVYLPGKMHGRVALK